MATSVDLTTDPLMPADASSQVAIGSHVSALKSAGDTHSAMALEKLGKAIARIENLLRVGSSLTLSAADLAGLSSASITVDTHVLSVATTNIVASLLPASGLLAVVLKQDATGGRLVTWDAASFVFSPGGMSTLANTYSVVLFVPSGTKWLQAAPPLTGKS